MGRVQGRKDAGTNRQLARLQVTLRGGSPGTSARRMQASPLAQRRPGLVRWLVCGITPIIEPVKSGADGIHAVPLQDKFHAAHCQPVSDSEWL